jgi:hypothetical protein
MNRGLRLKATTHLYGYIVSATKRTFLALWRPRSPGSGPTTVMGSPRVPRAERVSKIEQTWTESVA